MKKKQKLNLKNPAWKSNELHGEYAYAEFRSHKKGQILRYCKFLITHNFFPKVTNKGVETLKRDMIPHKQNRFFADVREGRNDIKHLDIGCNAALNMWAIDHFFGSDLYNSHGFDINEKALAMAKKKLPKANFTISNFLLENPLQSFDDNHFDFCSCTWVLSHMPAIPKRENLIKEMVRVSQKGIIIEASSQSKDVARLFSAASSKDIEEVNIVIFDDYRHYSNLIKVYDSLPYYVKSPKKEALFYWMK